MSQNMRYTCCSKYRYLNLLFRVILVAIAFNVLEPLWLVYQQRKITARLRAYKLITEVLLKQIFASFRVCSKCVSSYLRDFFLSRIAVLQY